MVGDQEDGLGILGLEGKLDHVGAEVNLVADHLGAHVLQEETGADQADVAVVERGHLVAEVRQMAAAGGIDALEFGIGALGVPGGGHDAHVKAFADKLRAVADLGLRGKGDLADRGDGVELLHLFDVRLAQEGGVLGAAAGRVDEGPFEVDAEDLGVLLVLAVGRDVLHGLDEIFLGDGEGGRAPGGAAFLKLGLGDLLDGGGVVRVADVDADGAVGMDVDEAGHHHVSLGVVDPVGLREGSAGLEDLLDAAVFDDDGAAVKLVTGADDVGVLDKTCSHDTVLLSMFRQCCIVYTEGPPRRNPARRVLPETPHVAFCRKMLECAHMEKQPIPQIEGFTFRQRLTASARGEIWRAEQRALERDVLVLCFHPETVRNAALLDALFAAIRRLASIKTDLFPDIVDLVRTADEVYVILEDTHAQHLIGLLAGRRLNAEQANVIASKLAEGFSRLREAGLVYANLNPENLYLSDLSEPILPDISLLQFEAGKGPVAMPDSLEASPVYAAPEQYLAPQEVDSRADMFSLGLTLYTLVSGQVPFSGLDPEAVMRAKLEHTVASPCDFSPSLPPAFAAALERLCQRDPAERPQDWDEVLFDFHLAARGEEPYRVRPPEHSVIAPPDPMARRRAGNQQ